MDGGKMSLKILNGFIADKNLQDMFYELRAFRNDLLSVQKEVFLKTFGEDLANTFDVSKKEVNIQEMLGRIQQFVEAHKYQIHVFTKYDFETSVLLAPYGDKTVMLFFSNIEEFHEKFRELGFLKEFNYFDPKEDDSISDEDWEMRGKIWNEIFSFSQFPLHSMFQFTLLDTDMFAFYDDIRKNIYKYYPKHEKRAEYVVNTKIISREKDFQIGLKKIEELRKTEQYNKLVNDEISLLSPVRFN